MNANSMTRDIIIGAVCGTVGLIVGLLPVWNGRSVDERPYLTEAQDEPARTRTPRAQSAPTLRARRAAADAPAPQREASSPRRGARGPEASDCDAACVERTVGALLSGRADSGAYDDFYGSIDAMIEGIQSDPTNRRRFLAALGQISAASDDEAYDPYREFLLSVATSYDLSGEFREDITRRLGQSSDPAARAVALQVAFSGDTQTGAQDAIADAISREQDGETLVTALSYLPSIGEDIRPGTIASVRQLASGNRDPDVRRAALEALASAPADLVPDRQRLLEAGLSDRAPAVRLGAIEGLSRGEDAAFSRRQVRDYREVVGEIANDPSASPEDRMRALEMLTYGALSEDR